MKNSKGITLVALVVTIIVLLILAGVSLSLVAGSNGLITRASGTSATNADATAKEQAELEIAAAVADWYEDYYVNKNTTDNDLADFLEENLNGKSITGGTLTVASGTATVAVTATGNSYEASVDSNGGVGAWTKVTASTPEPGSGD